MHTSVRESPGVHVCHKCGWPFPNPHPSAKHRRAHKRVCGSIEGYKLVDSEDLDISDENNLSDEDRKIPSPELTEKSNNEKHNIGISERSNRSEDDVFSDAVTEFPDSGLCPEVQEHFEDAKIAADNIEPSSNSTDIDKMQNLEVPENKAAFSGSDFESLACVSNSTGDAVVTFTNDQVQLACDLSTAKPEIRTDASQEIKMINSSDDVTEDSMAYIRLEADAKCNDAINSDSNVVVLSPGEYTGKTCEAESKTQEQEEIMLNLVSSDGVGLLKEENGDEMASDVSLTYPATGVESFEHLNAPDAAQIKVGAEQGLDLADAQIKVGAEQGLDLANSINSNRSFSGKGEGKENVCEHSISDIPVVDKAEIMHQGFKDYKGLKFLPSATSDSCEIVNDKKDNVEDPLSIENFTSSHSVRLREVTDVPASKMTVLEDNLLHEDGVPMVQKLSSEGKSNGHQVLNEVNPMIASREKDIAEMYDAAGKSDNGSYAKNGITTSESANILSEFSVNRATNLLETDGAADHEKTKVEKSDVVGVESWGEFSFQKETALESDSSQQEYLGAVHVFETKLPETEFINLGRISSTEDITKQLEISGNVKTQGGCVAEHGRNVEILDGNSQDHAMKDHLVSPLDTETSVQSSVAVDDNHAGDVGGKDYVINQSLQLEGDDNGLVKHQLGPSAIDVSVDSLSQTDSLEGNWGSISVLSTQSETLAVVDAETLQSTDYPASKEAEKTNLKKAMAVTERQHSEKSDIFEAPSFMTLVEPGGGSHHKASASASTIPTVQNPQQQNAPSSQAGWFPSLTNVVNESRGRKKNEEIIAKVTNWSTGKQHTPLKNLLGEANLESKPKSPQMRGNRTSVIQQDETMSKDNGALATTVSSILRSGVPTTEPARSETGKEPNSPARYLPDIKREKRKVKGRPYWVQFVCCSSVN